MKNLIFFVLIAFLTFTDKLSFAEEINEDWVKKDSIFINQIKRAYATNPLLVEKFLEPWENSREKLGFGYSMIEHSNGKGYVSINYTLIYKGQKLVSFVLKTSWPHDPRLTKRYSAFFNGLFEIENFEIKDLYFGYEVVSKPIGFKENEFNVSSQIAYFMTPYSGVVYGDSGGIANEVLETRKSFNSIQSSINEEVLFYLLKSINPATRLYAAEFYYLNKERFSEREIIEKLIDENLKELPKITTMSGCIVRMADARKVLKAMIEEYKYQ